MMLEVDVLELLVLIFDPLVGLVLYGQNCKNFPESNGSSEVSVCLKYARRNSCLVLYSHT